MSETVLNFGCPSCHNAVRSTTDKIGSNIECPSCKCFITVPSDYFSSTLVQSGEYIYYKCPSCSKEYKSSLDKAGSAINCFSCFHHFLIPPKLASVSKQQQPKLIDCQDCGASISRLAAACPICGRPVKKAESAPPTGLLTMTPIFFIVFVLLVGLVALAINDVAKQAAKDKEFAQQQLLRDIQENIRNTKAATRNAQDFLYGKGNSQPLDVRVVE